MSPDWSLRQECWRFWHSMDKCLSVRWLRMGKCLSVRWLRMGKCLSVRWLRIFPSVVERGVVFHVQILPLTSHKRNLLKTTDCVSTLTALKLPSVSSRTKVKAFRLQPRAWSYSSGYIKDIIYVDSGVTRSSSVNYLGHVYLHRKFLTMVVRIWVVSPALTGTSSIVTKKKRKKRKQYVTETASGKVLVNVADITRIYVFTFHLSHFN